MTVTDDLVKRLRAEEHWAIELSEAELDVYRFVESYNE